jgi:Mg-chelatase subunit ChlD
MPAEAFNQDDVEEISGATAWDVAVRYHEFKSKSSMKNIAQKLRSISAQAVLEKAIKILGSVTHPLNQRTSILSELPYYAEQVEIDIEETLENSMVPVVNRQILPQDVWMSFSVPKRQSMILTVDTSLSMTGEKLALTAVALAVVLLQFPDDPIGIIAFENEPKILKLPEEKISVEQLVERFLDVPAHGYTHLEDGMKAALNMSTSTLPGVYRGQTSVVLLSDGKYTAGRDPTYLAHRFNHLVVMKMGKEKASLDLCKELAHKGRGVLKEVGELESLPHAMYSVVKDLLRGRPA